MERLSVWWSKEARGFGDFLKIFFGFLMLSAGAITIAICMDQLGVPMRDESGFLQQFNGTILVFFLLILPVELAVEEILFRLPLVLFIRKNARPSTLIIVSVVLSVLFGLAHGGWAQVPLQGLMGFGLCMIFLKSGGAQKKYGKAFLWALGIHILYDWLVIGIAFSVM